jgi:hypothetical protein
MDIGVLAVQKQRYMQRVSRGKKELRLPLEKMAIGI